MRKVVIGQAGGPTAVINASLVGFLENVEDTNVYGAIKGFQGLVEDDLVHIKGDLLKRIKLYHSIPGACLGAGRYNMDEEAMGKAVDNLKCQGINTLVFIGGNGTMWALHQLSKRAQYIGYDLQVIGIPKTVDNDIVLTDHAPGFGSAARYVATSVRDISKDLESMSNFEQVRIIETMGRNVGWLAASSGYLKNSDYDGPHKIYLPEQILYSHTFLKDVKDIVKDVGFATIVVSEGVHLDEHAVVEKAIVNGRKVLGGIAEELANIVQKELGLIARNEQLGMNQRSNQFSVSLQDRKEAYEVGKQAAVYMQNDLFNIMVAINRSEANDYSFQLHSVTLDKVGEGGERHFDEMFIKNPKHYYQWLTPLVGADIEPFPTMITRRETNEKQFNRS